MNISTNIVTRESYAEKARRSDVIWHGSYDLLAVGFGQDMISHGITTDMIGHSLAGGAVSGLNKMSITTDQEALGDWAGSLLFS